MAAEKLEARVAALEAEVARLRDKVEKNDKAAEPLEKNDKAAEPWWKQIVGMFADDPLHEEATRLGREYRESLRPKPRKKKKK